MSSKNKKEIEKCRLFVIANSMSRIYIQNGKVKANQIKHVGLLAAKLFVTIFANTDWRFTRLEFFG